MGLLKKKTPHVTVMFLATTLLLLVIYVAVSLGISMRQRDLILSQASASADSLFESIVLTRRWSASHGGVYVLKEPGVESNPYLKHPDIVATDGKVYTKKNPALMTREISELAHAKDVFSFHITSLNLINPANKADAWETKALKGFEKGEKSRSELVTTDGQKMFRLIRPLYFEESCNECHSNLGYHVGDVRGGISVSIPFEATDRQLVENARWMIFLTGSTIILFGIIMYVFLWRLLKKLATINALKDKLLGIVAHDCRNLLNLIRGNLEIVCEGVVGDINKEQKEIINNVNIATLRMSVLVDDLLDASVIESGHLVLKKTLCDPEAVFQEFCDFSRPYANARSMKLVLDLDPHLPRVAFDQNRIGQVMGNLIGNAIKYSNPHTEIRVKVSRHEDGLQVAVADQGFGFDPQDIPQLFSGYSKVGGIPTIEKSTGLGLVIAKHIVTSHGGRFWAESTPGKGSTFFFTLPA